MKIKNLKSTDIKKLLKSFKMNESNISMVLGAIVVVVVGILIVNYIKDRRDSLTSSLATEAQKNGVKTHTVVKGETLWSIAEDTYGSGYNWTDISKENKLTSDNIEVGQELVLPNVESKMEKAEVVSGVVKISADTYTVSKGDSLWDIAVRSYGDGYKWVEIAKANNLTNPDVIHAGNVLTLPR